LWRIENVSKIIGDMDDITSVSREYSQVEHKGQGRFNIFEKIKIRYKGEEMK
jgi:hypothetical protein